MKLIGFSTGALAKGDFRRALRMIEGRGTTAVEFSALRTEELDSLLEFVTSHAFPEFRYVAFHAPSKFSRTEEEAIVERLSVLKNLAWPIVVHPDALRSSHLWRSFGSQLCIENMDQRKPIGRTCDEMEEIFERFPEASFCFDIGHAHQVDPSMSQAYCMLERFRNRIKQLHFSEVDAASVHRPVGWLARSAFETIVSSVPEDAAIILEAVIDEADMATELHTAREVFGLEHLPA